MRVEYSKRAIADLRQTAAYYTRSGNPAVAARIAGRIEELVARIAVAPLSGRPVIQRPGVRVALLRSCRYKIYRRDIGPIWGIAEALEYGIVGIDEGIISTEIAPFGGMKESGIGRENSKYGVEEFLEKYLCMGSTTARCCRGGPRTWGLPSSYPWPAVSRPRVLGL